MKRGLLGALALGALLAGPVLADSAQTPTPDALKVQALQVPLTETAQSALRELNTERETFVQSFDWGTRDQLVTKQIEFQQGADRYLVRSHEIMRDMYQETGHMELAAFEQGEIERLERAAAHTPATGDAAAVTAGKTIEAPNGEDLK